MIEGVKGAAQVQAMHSAWGQQVKRYQFPDCKIRRCTHEYYTAHPTSAELQYGRIDYSMIVQQQCLSESSNEVVREGRVRTRNSQ